MIVYQRLSSPELVSKDAVVRAEGGYCGKGGFGEDRLKQVCVFS